MTIICFDCIQDLELKSALQKDALISEAESHEVCLFGHKILLGVSYVDLGTLINYILECFRVRYIDSTYGPTKDWEVDYPTYTTEELLVDYGAVGSPREAESLIEAFKISDPDNQIETEWLDHIYINSAGWPGFINLNLLREEFRRFENCSESGEEFHYSSDFEQILLNVFSVFPMIHNLPKDTEVYRARTAESKFEKSATNLGTAPKEFTPISRMSPARQPLFYGANSPETALREIAPLKQFSVTARFSLNQDIRILSLLPVQFPSIFNPEFAPHFSQVYFLNDYIALATRDSRDEDDIYPWTHHLFSWFCRHLDVEGVAWISTKDRERKAKRGEQPICYALNFQNNQMLDSPDNAPGMTLVESTEI